MITVEFQNVGRSKASWTAQLKSLTASTLTREIMVNQALLSRSIYFDYDEKANQGTIYVGMGRTVGTFRIVEAQ